MPVLSIRSYQLDELLTLLDWSIPFQCSVFKRKLFVELCNRSSDITFGILFCSLEDLYDGLNCIKSCFHSLCVVFNDDD